MNRFALCLRFVFLLIGVAPATAPIYDNLGDHRHPVTTGSPEAQRYFDQGLRLAYGLNHDEA